MDFISLLLIATILFIGYFIIRFIGFRNKLITAFNSYGVQDAVANSIYTANLDYINKLHHDGHSAEQIASKVLEETGYYIARKELEKPIITEAIGSVNINEPNYIICPFCAEKIKAKAKKCKHCREWLSDLRLPQ